MNKTEKAAFAAGCFWGIEEAFSKVKGVVSTVAGYMGGDFKNPTYHDVCRGSTGHAETVEIAYDPTVVSYDDLLNLFWKIHDPTTKDRQGPDIGSQYRSMIFYYSPEQEKIATKSKEQMQQSGRYKREIQTEIKSAAQFYRAEEYHQHYNEKNQRKCSKPVLEDASPTDGI